MIKHEINIFTQITDRTTTHNSQHKTCDSYAVKLCLEENEKKLRKPGILGATGTLTYNTIKKVK